MWARAVLFGDDGAKRWLSNSNRGMLEGIGSKGGAVVPVEMSDAIIDLREEYGVARQELRILPMGSDHLVVPRRTSPVCAPIDAQFHGCKP